MTVVESKLHMTVDEFDQFVELPENADTLFEFVGGEVVEVPSNAYVSMLAGIIFGELYIFLKGKGLGYLTGEAGGYQVSGERYAPDVAFVSTAKQPQPPRQGYNPVAPDLAVEVLSPGNTAREMRIKITNYINDGVTVWLVDPIDKIIEVHAPGQRAVTLTVSDTLDGGALLAGFTLAIKDIFPPEPES